MYIGYIVEIEVYLGLNDCVVYGYGGKIIFKVMLLYKCGGIIYVYVMYMYLFINFVIKFEGIFEGVFICVIELEDGLFVMFCNRGKKGYEVMNGLGKWIKVFNILWVIDGVMLNDCRLFIDIKNCKYFKDIIVSLWIGILNKGDWIYKFLCYIVKGNLFVFCMCKLDCMFFEDIWK